MAKAKLVCSDCDNELSVDDKFCSKCGSKVEREKETNRQPATQTEAVVPCEVCGHENLHTGSYCEACGATLPGRASGQVVSSPSKRSLPSKKNQSARSHSWSFEFETWHYIVGVLILGLVGFFSYLELQREHGTASGQQSSTQMQFPAQQAPSTPPTKEILEAIERLQKTAKENPNDVGAKLLLANALHDGAMHDGSMFPRAIEAYKSYLKAKPGDPNARVDLGICYFELGKIDSLHSASLFEQAIGEMETTLKNNPKHQAGAFNLGIVYLWTGDIQQSNKWLQKAIEINTESDLGKRAKAILEQHSQAG